MAEQKEPKRLNRAVPLSEAVGKMLDPVLRKRGFANRDLLQNWAVIAPRPFDTQSAPDRLSWPRGERSAEGATLFIRCVPALTLALAHEGERIAAAINRYFGYVLVKSVRHAIEPFSPPPDQTPPLVRQASEVTRAKVGRAVSDVQDEGLRDALRKLGYGIARKSGR